jgi:hypothetical protein
MARPPCDVHDTPPLGSPRASASSTPTNAPATRSRSTSWKPCAAPSTATFSIFLPTALSAPATSPKRRADNVASRLASELATTTLTWAAEVGSHTEQTGRHLSKAAGIPAPPTLLTGASRRPTRHAQPSPVQGAPTRRHADLQGLRHVDQRRQAVPPRAMGPPTPSGSDASRAPRPQDAATPATTRHPDQKSGPRSPRLNALNGLPAASQTPAGSPGRHPSSAGSFSPTRRMLTTRPRERNRTIPRLRAQVRDGKRIPHVRHWAAFQLAGLAWRHPAT